MYPDLAALGAFWLAFALALVSPGPNFALMLRIGLAEGRGAAHGAGRRRGRGRLGRLRDRPRAHAPQPQGRVLPGLAHRRPARGRRERGHRRRGGDGAVLLSVLWHGALALAFSGERLTRAYARARRGIEAALGAALAALGVRLLAAG